MAPKRSYKFHEKVFHSKCKTFLKALGSFYEGNKAFQCNIHRLSQFNKKFTRPCLEPLNAIFAIKLLLNPVLHEISVLFTKKRSHFNAIFALKFLLISCESLIDFHFSMCFGICRESRKRLKWVGRTWFLSYRSSRL